MLAGCIIATLFASIQGMGKLPESGNRAIVGAIPGMHRLDNGKSLLPVHIFSNQICKNAAHDKTCT
jgi:hypothetical protein